MVINYLKIVLSKLNEFILYRNKRENNLSEYRFKTETIKSANFNPIFFLSTGRTGTDFFTQLLGKSDNVQVFHSPSNLFCNAQSELIEQGKIAYEMYKKYGFNDERTNKLTAQIFMAAREDLLYKTYLHNKIYIETNNRITFLAPAIKCIFPNAKFIHLYRHPGEFIRSGIRRRYYSSNSIHETGRLVPLKMTKYFSDWSNFDEIQKIAWLWSETNNFIGNFLETLNSDDYFNFNFNHLTTTNIENLLKFLQIEDIDSELIEKTINKPTNTQKAGFFPEYKEWNQDDKNKVIDLCEELNLKYGYEL